MNYEERQKWVCHDCGKDNCAYVNRSLEYKCPFLDAVMYGWEFGFNDAIDKAFDWLIERYENQGVILLEDINEFKHMMEE